MPRTAGRPRPDIFDCHRAAVPNDHALPRALGCAGSALIAGASMLPGPAGVPGVYGGLALLGLAWWAYRRPGVTVRDSYVTLALWVAPLLVAPPLFSRDVYSYLAQGLMLRAGLDVYHSGPAALGGVVADQVPAIWQDTPSPYGPVFLIVARLISGVTDHHLVTGVLLLRLVAVGGLALLAVAVPVLARATGMRVPEALWLAVLNPLVLIHLVGGAHNDALMVALLAAGLAAAVRHRPALGTLLVVAAALIKAPAALGLVAVAAIWAGHLPGRWPAVRAVAAVSALAIGITVVITRISGTGYGWIGALATPISPGNWSPTGLLGRWTADLITRDDVGAALAMNLWRWAGILATLIVAALVGTYRHRLGPLTGLGVVLLALVIFGPALRPWYVIWGLVPLAVAVHDTRVRLALALLCAALLPMVLPDGFPADGEKVLLAAIGALGGIAVFALARTVPRVVPVRVAR
jgi:alpha-1,6-mannosyltransferase